MSSKMNRFIVIITRFIVFFSVYCLIAVEGNYYAGSGSDIYTTQEFWSDIAVSADGQFIIAVTFNGGGVIQRTTDGGSSWSLVSLSGSGGLSKSVWTSRTGGKVLIPDQYNNLFYSSDYAATFTALNSGGPQQVVASNDASKIFAAIYNSGIYVTTSVNGGTTSWTQANTASGSWTGSCASDDGVYSAFTNYNAGTAGLYLSSNSGTSYSAITIAYTSGSNLGSVACDSTGQYFAVAVTGGYIWTSSDYGATFTEHLDYSNNFLAISMSSDGSYISAVSNNGYVYISSDYGSTWGQMTRYVNNAYGTGNYCNFQGSALDSSNNLYTVCDDGYIIKYTFTIEAPSYTPTCTPTFTPAFTPTHTPTISSAVYVISTIAGSNTGGYAGDGGKATSAKLLKPDGVSVDSSGQLIIVYLCFVTYLFLP